MGKDGQSWAKMDGVAAQLQRRSSAKDVDPPILTYFIASGREGGGSALWPVRLGRLACIVARSDPLRRSTYGYGVLYGGTY
jgi:hypothetical protein